MHKDILLTIDFTIAEKAVKYAEKNGKNLSQLFEEYLQIILLRQEKSMIQLTPIAGSLKGAVKASFNYKKALNDDLSNNHLQ